MNIEDSLKQLAYLFTYGYWKFSLLKFWERFLLFIPSSKSLKTSHKTPKIYTSNQCEQIIITSEGKSLHFFIVYLIFLSSSLPRILKNWKVNFCVYTLCDFLKREYETIKTATVRVTSISGRNWRFVDSSINHITPTPLVCPL